MALEEPKYDIPTSLFHTILTVADGTEDSTFPITNVLPLGTHADLQAAKEFSSKALQGLGYSPSDFDVYQERPKEPEPDKKEWPYGDGVIVHAVRTGPHDFLVSIVTTPNEENLNASNEDPAEIALPRGAGPLHYVMQTKVDYGVENPDKAQSTEIEGVYLKRADALAAAKTCLLGADVRREDYAQYDGRSGEELKDEWPDRKSVV